MSATRSKIAILGFSPETDDSSPPTARERPIFPLDPDTRWSAAPA